MNDLKEKVIVVTGSAQGLGAAICAELSAAGAFVIATDINKEKLVDVEKGIKETNGKIRTYSMDVADEKNGSSFCCKKYTSGKHWNQKH